jgi:DNA-binding SARP family transcriptional activator/WD40 repeat protein
VACPANWRQVLLRPRRDWAVTGGRNGMVSAARGMKRGDDAMARNSGVLPRSKLEFAVLGPLQVRSDAGQLALPSTKERALLAHLLARASRTVSTDELIDTLWGETPPRTAAKALQNHVLRLRNILEPDRDGSPVLLVTDGSGYRLNVADDAIDARRFERLFGLGRRALHEGKIEAAAATLADALELWRGPAYAGLESTAFGGSEARRLEELRLVALEDRIAADLDLGKAREMVGELESLVHEHPLRERFWQLLILALYRSDRQADALAAYSRARDVLVEELGVEPSGELRRLQVQVLEQDSALQAPPRVVVLPDALVPPPGPFVGRHAELAILRAAWERMSASGTPGTVVLRGPRGAGVTRLAAQFAGELADRGVSVEYHSDAVQPAESTPRPVLSVVDLRRSANGAVDDAQGPDVADGPRLTVVLTTTSTPAPAGTEVIEIGSLQPDDVRAILATYVDETVADDALDEVLRASAGLPGRVHNEGLAVARQRTAAAVSGAAAWAGRVGTDLEAARAELREGVTRYRELIERQAVVDSVTCPWKGLVAYGVADAPWFAGRERLVAELLTRMASARLVALVGGSGSGKSSLLHAGLLASLQAGALPGSERWVPVVMRPGPHPMRQMVRAALSGADTTEDRTAELLEHIVFGAPAASRIVLIVDQFEEVWTACTDAAERQSFLDALAEVVDSTSRCTVVLGVRADHVAGLADQPTLAQALADATVLIGTPTAAEVRRAIEHPAQLAGLVLDVGLADALVDDAGDEPGSLPLLSTALTELWDERDGRRLTLEAYAQSGGLRGAVARIAERAYGELDENDRTAARVLLIRLAGPGEGDAVTRRRVPLTELAALPNPRVRAVIEPLADARLLSLDAGYVEAAHEALFREWPRLRAWLEQHAAARAVQHRLAVAAAEWDEGGRERAELWRGSRLSAGLEFAAAYPDEVTTVERAYLDAGQAQLDAERRDAEERAAAATRQNRRLRWLIGGLGVFLVLALIAGGLFLDQRNRADVRALQSTALSEDRWDRALLYAAQAQQFDASAEARAALLETVQRGPEATAMFTADQALHSLVVSLDGRRIVAGGSNGSVFVWDVETREVQEIPDVTAFENDTLDISPDGRYVAAVGIPVSVYKQDRRDWHVIVVDLDQQPPTVRPLPWPRAVNGMVAARFAADGRTLVTVDLDGVIRYVDVQSGKVKRTLEFKHVGSGFGDVSMGRRFMVASNDDTGLVTAWEVDSGRRIWSSVEPDGTVAAVSPFGSQLVIGHADGRIERVNIETKSRTEITPSLGTVPIDLTFTRGRFAAATEDRSVLVWDAETLEVQAVLRGHWGRLSQLTYSDEWPVGGTTMYAAGFDGSVLAWDLTHQQGVVEHVATPTPGAQATALAADGTVVASGYQDADGGRIEVTEFAGRTFQVKVPELAQGDLFGVTVDRLGRSVVVGIIARLQGRRPFWVRTIDVRRGQISDYTIALEHQGASDAMVTWDNGAVLAAGGRQLSLWNMDSGSPLVRELYEAAGAVGVLSVHPNGRLVALSESRVVEVIDLRSGNVVETLPHNEQLGVRPLVFSPDGWWLAGATGSGRVMIWNTRTWQQHNTWEAVSGFGIDSMVFTPDSDFLITGGAGQAAIWNVDQGASGGVRLDVDPSRTDASVLVGVRDDGRTLVTYTEGTGVREWDVSPDGLLEHACAVVGRNLTRSEWEDVLPDRSYERTCPEYENG